MSDRGDSTKLRSTLHKRHNVLAALAVEPKTKPELVDTVESSRSTIDRAISALEATDCIERLGSDYHPTQLGRVSLAEGLAEFDNMNSVAGTLEERPLIHSLADEDPATGDSSTTGSGSPTTAPYRR